MKAEADAVRQLEAAIARLPVLDERREFIASSVQQLYASGVFGKMNELPRVRFAGKPASGEALKKLRKLTEELYQHFNNMPREALDAFDATAHPRFEREFRWLLQAIPDAMERLSEAPDQPRDAPQRKEQARFVTKNAELVFNHLTGKKVTRHYIDENEGGPFHDFLRDIFCALHIEASPAGQIRLLLYGKI